MRESIQKEGVARSILAQLLFSARDINLKAGMIAICSDAVSLHKPNAKLYGIVDRVAVSCFASLVVGISCIRRPVYFTRKARWVISYPAE